MRGYERVIAKRIHIEWDLRELCMLKGHMFRGRILTGRIRFAPCEDV